MMNVLVVIVAILLGSALGIGGTAWWLRHHVPAWVPRASPSTPPNVILAGQAYCTVRVVVDMDGHAHTVHESCPDALPMSALTPVKLSNARVIKETSHVFFVTPGT